MCSSKTPKTPKIQTAPPPPQLVTPVEADETIKNANDAERRRRLASTGQSSTILTSGLGDRSNYAVGNKKLLGE